MKRKLECSACGGRELYRTEVDSVGSYGPDLLPHVGNHWRFWKVEKLEVVTCGSCGLYQIFVPEQYLGDIREKWQRLG